MKTIRYQGLCIVHARDGRVIVRKKKCLSSNIRKVLIMTEEVAKEYLENCTLPLVIGQVNILVTYYDEKS